MVEGTPERKGRPLAVVFDLHKPPEARKGVVLACKWEEEPVSGGWFESGACRGRQPPLA